MVILGHVIFPQIDGISVDGRLYNFIYSFHMPLFMLLSGYFVSNKLAEQSFLKVIKRKAKQLLLPALTCSVICCLFLYCVKESPNYRNEIIGNSWFLKTLFVYYIFIYLLRQIHVNDWILFIGSCSVLFIIPHMSTLQINLLFPYFWGGCLLRRYKVLEGFAYMLYKSIGIYPII